MHGEINLTNIGGGAAVEKFQEDLERVIENIIDPNYEATAKREIVLKVSIKPDKDRSWGVVEIQSTAKLASGVAYSTRAFFGTKDGRTIACEDNPNQTTIEDFIVPAENVAEIKTKKTAEFLAKQLEDKKAEA